MCFSDSLSIPIASDTLDGIYGTLIMKPLKTDEFYSRLDRGSGWLIFFFTEWIYLLCSNEYQYVLSKKGSQKFVWNSNSYQCEVSRYSLINFHISHFYSSNNFGYRQIVLPIERIKSNVEIRFGGAFYEFPENFNLQIQSVQMKQIYYSFLRNFSNPLY
jgi:hypothetical protein